MVPPLRRPGGADTRRAGARWRWAQLLAAVLLGYMLSIRAPSPTWGPARVDPPRLTVPDRRLSASCDRAACRAVARRERPLIFWHVSKCGGTSVCQGALENGERVQDTHHCHPEPHSVRKGLSFGGPEEQGAALAELFRTQGGDTFTGVEDSLPRAGLSPAAVDAYNFIALREPRARYVSGIAEIEKHKQLNSEFTKTFANVTTTRGHLEILRDEKRADNFLVRYLLGLWNRKKNVVGVGLDRRITACDLEAAKAVLRDQMEFVLITERLGEAGCLLEQLGWEPELPHANIRESFVEEAEAEAGTEEEEAAVAALLDELTEFDRPLYTYAVELFERQLARCACCKQYRGRGAHQ